MSNALDVVSAPTADATDLFSNTWRPLEAALITDYNWGTPHCWPTSVCTLPRHFYRWTFNRCRCGSRRVLPAGFAFCF